MTKLIYVSLIIFLGTTNGRAQVRLTTGLDTNALSENFKRAISKKQYEYAAIISKDTTKIKKYSLAFILDKIDKSKSYNYIYIAEYWSSVNYSVMIPKLIERLTNKREVGLNNSGDLIIWERIDAKQMRFYGHGSVSEDDLFTVAGRANNILTIMSGERIGRVSMYSTAMELKALQLKWQNWLDSLYRQ